jgi:hypothetical protein
LLFASGGGGLSALRLVIVAILSLFSCNQSCLFIAIITIFPSVHLSCLFVVVVVITPDSYHLLLIVISSLLSPVAAAVKRHLHF